MSTTSDETEDTECPTCGRDDFASKQGMKTHHAQTHGESIAGVEVECDTCGTSFRREPNLADRNDRDFCSTECMGEWQSNQTGEDSPMWEGGCTEFECSWCGDVFEAYQSQTTDSNVNFCTKDCHNEWKVENSDVAHHLPTHDDDGNVLPEHTKTEIDCDWCGSELKRPPSLISDHNFCSDECQDNWQSENWNKEDSPGWSGGKVVTVCAQCGSFTEKRPSLIRDEKNFCDEDCMYDWQSENWKGDNHPAWSGGCVNYYGENWDTVSSTVRERDNHTCQKCGTLVNHRAISVHHITAIKHFKRWDVPDIEDANVPRNLISLCVSCHHRVEGGEKTPIPDSHWRAE